MKKDVAAMGRSTESKAVSGIYIPEWRRKEEEVQVVKEEEALSD